MGGMGFIPERLLMMMMMMMTTTLSEGLQCVWPLITCCKKSRKNKIHVFGGMLVFGGSFFIVWAGSTTL